jgi:hypothetical protein
MAVQTKIERIDKDITLFLADVSPAAQSAAIAEFAREQLDEVLHGNQSTLSAAATDYETFVDGRKGAPLDSVSPGGTIVFEFHILSDLIQWVDEMLIEFSPVRTGRYQSSHVLIVDGARVDPDGNIPDGKEFVLLNLQPYAEEIENDLSRQAPDGVFQAVAVLANAKFGQIASVDFEYRAAPSDAPQGENDRRPAIVITVV